jgi:hypothetical protein
MMTPISEVVILSIMSFLAGKSFKNSGPEDIDLWYVSAHESFMAYELWLKSMTDEIRRLQGPEDLESWELFPSSLQEMAEWADVYKDEDKHDKSRNHTLIYKHVPEEDMTTIFPVTIRLHGILEQFRVERFGNWSGLVYSQNHTIEDCCTDKRSQKRRRHPTSGSIHQSFVRRTRSCLECHYCLTQPR